MTAHPPRASELIDVRPDERLDPDRIEPWLRVRLPGAGAPVEVVGQFGGGYANLTYLLRCGDREYVLRRPPLGPVPPTAHDMQREHRVLSRLGAAYPLAPRSFALCTDPDVLGVDFHVLERRQGFVVRQQLPRDVAGDPATARRLGEALVDALAALHRVDPREVDLHDLGRPEGYVERQLAGWTRRWQATGRALPGVDRRAAWLRERLPRQQAATLLHNDFQIENILLDVSDPATIVAVLDWDMCTRGDPLMDLGYLLNCWSDPDDDASWRGVSPTPGCAPGLPTRAELVERYARATGFDVEHARWYHVFGVFKLAVVLEQIHVRFQRGQTRDARFGALGARVEGLAAKGLALI
ncbi:MAG: phosphotransferase family protein [Acidobacteria bacterium]|nr:phosphotransferase family protein [Acidobacteriota bacterium]